MNDYKKLLTQVKNGEYTLGSQERADIKNKLRSYIVAHPLQPTFREQVRTYFAYQHFSILVSRSVMALVVIFIVGAGSVYASQNALPGQPLYALKVNVAEPLSGFTALSPEAKAQWNAELATRRLEEAEQLAVKDELTPVVQAEITKQFEVHVNAFSQAIDGEASSTTDISVVAAAQSDFEASLSAHSAILEQVAFGTSTKPGIDLAHTVKAKAIAIGKRRRAAEATITADGTSTIQTAIAASISRTEASLDVLKKNNAGLRQARIPMQPLGVQAALSPQETETPIDSAEKKLQSGQEKLSRGEFRDAFQELQEASRAAKTAAVTAEANDALKTSVVVTVSTSSADVSGTSTLEVNDEHN